MGRRTVFANRTPWHRSSVVIACACLSLSCLSCTTATSRSDEPRADREARPRTRSVVFTYGGAVTGQTPGATVRVWLPVPSNAEDQQIRLARVNLPAAASFGAKSKYGNEILYFEAKADDQGRVPFEVAYYFGNLTENRVTFSVGRDLKLVPPQDCPPLNFLIYPYAEVNGQPVPSDKIEKKFSYRDQDGQ